MVAKLFKSLAGHTRFAYFCSALNAFCSQPEATSEVLYDSFVRPIVPNDSVKFCHPRLNRSREISAEDVRGGIFDVFCDNF